MDEARPGYYAVIPADVRYDDRIPANAKLLYGEISALIGADGFCFATNAYFMKIYGFSDPTITRLISLLVEHGYIKRELERDQSGQVVRRKLFLSVSVADVQPPIIFDTTPHQNQGEGTLKNDGYTNPSNTDILKENKKEKKTVDPLPFFVDWIRTTFPTSAPDRMNLLYKHLVAYKEMRSDSTSPLNTKRKVNGLLADLYDGSRGDLDTMCEMLKVSTRRCWLSVHPTQGQSRIAPSPQNEREYKCV